MNHLMILSLLVPLLSGMLLLMALPQRLYLARALSLSSVVAQFLIAVALVGAVADGEVLVCRLGDWPAPFGIVLVADRLSALMVLLAGALALPALVHASAGGDRAGPGFHALFQFQLLGLNGAFLTGDLFNLFVFFEILLIASYGLLLHGRGAARVRAGFHYVVLNLVGSALFLIAVGALYGVLGTLNMADLAQKAAHATPESLPVVRAAGLLLLVVFGLKAALVPLHFWLAPAYAAAAAPAAALFAIMTKVGVYAVLRVHTLIFDHDLTAPWLLPGALLTVAVAAIGVLASNELRELVAWLVVVSVGTLLAGVALFTTAGIGGALFYLVHTTLITGGLFLLADLVGMRQEGTWLEPGGRPPLRGWTGGLFVVGAAAAAGVPPFSGFIGKLLVLQAGGAAPIFPWIWALVLGGTLAALLSLSRAGSILFWKSDAPAPALSLMRMAPAAALLSAALWLALFAAPVAEYTGETARQLLAPHHYHAAVLGGGAGEGP